MGTPARYKAIAASLLVECSLMSFGEYDCSFNTELF